MCTSLKFSSIVNTSSCSLSTGAEKEMRNETSDRLDSSIRLPVIPALVPFLGHFGEAPHRSILHTMIGALSKLV